jgi:hypothetical protein
MAKGTKFFEDKLMYESYNRVATLYDKGLIDQSTQKLFDDILRGTECREVDSLEDNTIGVNLANVRYQSATSDCGIHIGGVVLTHCEDYRNICMIDHELVHILALAKKGIHADELLKRVQRDQEAVVKDLAQRYPEMSWPNSTRLDTSVESMITGNYKITADNLDPYQISLIKGILYAENKCLEESGANWLADLIARSLSKGIDINNIEAVVLLRLNGYGSFKNTFLKHEEKGVPLQELIDTALGVGYTLRELKEDNLKNPAAKKAQRRFVA